MFTFRMLLGVFVVIFEHVSCIRNGDNSFFLRKHTEKLFSNAKAPPKYIYCDCNFYTFECRDICKNYNSYYNYGTNSGPNIRHLVGPNPSSSILDTKKSGRSTPIHNMQVGHVPGRYLVQNPKPLPGLTDNKFPNSRHKLLDIDRNEPFHNTLKSQKTSESSKNKALRAAVPLKVAGMPVIATGRKKEICDFLQWIKRRERVMKSKDYEQRRLLKSVLSHFFKYNNLKKVVCNIENEVLGSSQRADLSGVSKEHVMVPGSQQEPRYNIDIAENAKSILPSNQSNVLQHQGQHVDNVLRLRIDPKIPVHDVKSATTKEKITLNGNKGSGAYKNQRLLVLEDGLGNRDSTKHAMKKKQDKPAYRRKVRFYTSFAWKTFTPYITKEVLVYPATSYYTTTEVFTMTPLITLPDNDMLRTISSNPDLEDYLKNIKSIDMRLEKKNIPKKEKLEHVRMRHLQTEDEDSFSKGAGTKHGKKKAIDEDKTSETHGSAFIKKAVSDHVSDDNMEDKDIRASINSYRGPQHVSNKTSEVPKRHGSISVDFLSEPKTSSVAFSMSSTTKIKENDGTKSKGERLSSSETTSVHESQSSTKDMISSTKTAYLDGIRNLKTISVTSVLTKTITLVSTVLEKQALSSVLIGNTSKERKIYQTKKKPEDAVKSFLESRIQSYCIGEICSETSKPVNTRVADITKISGSSTSGAKKTVKMEFTVLTDSPDKEKASEKSEEKKSSLRLLSDTRTIALYDPKKLIDLDEGREDKRQKNADHQDTWIINEGHKYPKTQHLEKKQETEFCEKSTPLSRNGGLSPIPITTNTVTNQKNFKTENISIKSIIRKEIESYIERIHGEPFHTQESHSKKCSIKNVFKSTTKYVNKPFTEYLFDKGPDQRSSVLQMKSMSNIKICSSADLASKEKKTELCTENILKPNKFASISGNKADIKDFSMTKNINIDSDTGLEIRVDAI